MKAQLFAVNACLGGCVAPVTVTAFVDVNLKGGGYWFRDLPPHPLLIAEIHSLGRRKRCWRIHIKHGLSINRGLRPLLQQGSPFGEKCSAAVAH